MARLGVLVLLILLGASIWFASSWWTELEAADMPPGLYAAMIGGVVFSILVGCGLMALVFYSSRHGYDDEAHGSNRRRD